MRYLLLSLVLFAIPAHADTYALSGTALFTGNNTCSGVCTESVAFSFDLSYEAVDNYMGSHQTAYLAQISNLNESWSGDAGSFNGSYPGPDGSVGNPEPALGCAGGGTNYIQLDDSFLDEVDLQLCDDAEPFPVVPSVDGATLYRCVATACKDNFNASAFDLGTLENASVITITPEPSTFGLLFVGLFGVWGIRRKLSAEVRAAVPNS